MPYLIGGIVTTCIGAGLLTTLDAGSAAVRWATFMVIEGLGMGVAMQIPYHALQAVLE